MVDVQKGLNKNDRIFAWVGVVSQVNTEDEEGSSGVHHKGRWGCLEPLCGDRYSVAECDTQGKMGTFSK